MGLRRPVVGGVGRCPPQPRARVARGFDQTVEQAPETVEEPERFAGLLDVAPRNAEDQRGAQLLDAALGDAEEVLSVAAPSLVPFLDVEEDAARGAARLVTEGAIAPLKSLQRLSQATNCAQGHVSRHEAHVRSLSPGSRRAIARALQ